jgi:hypothetical protein
MAKICTCCQRDQDWSLFYHNVRRPDGFEDVCKECRHKREVQHRAARRAAVKQDAIAMELAAKAAAAREMAEKPHDPRTRAEF